MKKTEHSKIRFLITIIIMVLLILAGVMLTIRMLDNYGTLVLQNTDNQLISLARSVDRSVEGHLVRYTENLLHTMEHEECIEAENLWLIEGKESEVLLLEFLEKSLLGQDKSIVDILVLVEDEVRLAQSGELDYQFLAFKNIDEMVEISPCVGGDGTIYMGIIQNMENRASYAVLINLADFYEEITNNLSTELQNEIVMMDADAKTLVHRRDDVIVVDAVGEFTEEDSKFSMLTFLLKQQKEGSEGTEFCDAVSSATGRAYRARMVVVPATEETNGAFAVGVSTDYDEMIRPMRASSIKLMIYGGTVLLAVVGLLILLQNTLRGSERAQREVELLKEKNAAMEELNRQTQEFAHHQRLELMGTLTSGIAHEFNNLLAPIMGYSILVLEKLPPEETELYDEVLEIYNTSTKAKTVVSRLQDLARKNTGTDFKALVLDEVVKKAAEIVSPAKPKPVELEVKLNTQGNLINGNETQISQLLLNLLINAFHATEEKGGKVTVETQVKGDHLLLMVADNGYGMSEEVRERIFEPFFTTKKGGQGTGLGLAIAWQVVEEHKGTIFVESREGEETVFWVEFPILFEKS